MELPRVFHGTGLPIEPHPYTFPVGAPGHDLPSRVGSCLLMATTTPHDALVKLTFSRIEHAAQMFRSVLPPALVAQIDFRTLKRAPGSFVDEVFRDRFTDLVFSVRAAGRDALLYILYEHQSKVEPLLILRIWTYLAEMWNEHAKNHGDAGRLPLIIPVVVHHSATGWTAATTMDEVVDHTPALCDALGDCMPRLGFFLDDLSVQEDDALRARAMDAMPTLAMLALKHARNAKDLRDKVRSWADLMQELLGSPSGVRSLALIVRYLLLASDIVPDELQSILTTSVGPRGNEAFMTGAEILQSRSRIEERRKILQRLLTLRFGALSDDTLAILDRAQPEELERWVDRVITAQSLDDVFADNANDNA